jgi:UDP-N-acetylmuramate dehydrogenase
MKKQTNIYSALVSKFNLLTDEPLKRHTSFKIGGPADLFAQPENAEQLKQLIMAAREHNIPVTLFGGGTNLLVSDKGIRGLVITTKQLQSAAIVLPKEAGTDPDTERILADAGERLASICRFAADRSLSGLEFAAGIPGTLGGAVIMNAGGSTAAMADIVESVQIMEPDTLEIGHVYKDAIDFSYRRTNLSGILLKIVLKLKIGDKNEIEAAIFRNLKQKKQTQPVKAASAGCFFKNPEQGKAAGQLIEAAGLKGMRINDAQISTIHANYIVNLNNATCRDILDLKQMVEKTIMDKFHIKLETEVRVEGE